MAINYLNKTGLGELWGKIKGLIPTKVSDLNNDSGFQTQAQVESAIAQSAEVVFATISYFNSTYTANKTYTELNSAYNAKKILALKWGANVYYVVAHPLNQIKFSRIIGTGTNFKCDGFIVNSDDTVEKFELENVRTINGKTGAVTLTYSDVGALPDSTVIPTKVSDLNNDSGFQTQAQVNALIAAAGDDDTTYAISISGNVITLTGSDGNTSTVTLPVYTGGVT